MSEPSLSTASSNARSSTVSAAGARASARASYEGSEAHESGRRLKPAMWPSVVGQALYAASVLRVKAWDRALKNLRKTQEKQLLSILRKAKDTEYGRRFGFASVRSYEDYRARVPLADYDAFAPYIERMRQGEEDLLYPGLIRYFGNSSGSSNKGRSKFLPISEEQIKTQRGAAADCLMRYLAASGEKDITGGYTLGLYPPTVMRREGPVWITTNPSLQSIRIPAFTRPLMLPEGHIRVVKDYDRRLEMIVDRYMDYDVRIVSGTTCWFSLLFDKLLETARKRGRNVQHVRELWPNLRLMIGGGVSADPYLPVIAERMGTNDFTLVDTYNATEGGIYATTDHSGERGMLMIPDRGVFFEFVPAEDVGKPGARRVPLWEVETDQLYSIIPTTSSGLYAYQLGDYVRFTSLSPLRMEFAGRLQGCLSTTQELTTHVEIQRATEAALAATGARTVDYGAGADVGIEGSARSRYILFAEFLGGVPDLKSFGREFDRALCEQNRVYREHRDGDLAIVAPEVISLPEGSVARFMDEIGNHSVQTKFPRILDDERKELLRSYVS